MRALSALATLSLSLAALASMGGVAHAQAPPDGPPEAWAATATALEPAPVAAAGLTLIAPDVDWRQVAPEGAERGRLERALDDGDRLTLSLQVLDAATTQGASARDVLDDWELQLRGAADPRVQVEARGVARRGGILGIEGALRFQGRMGLYFAFLVADPGTGQARWACFLLAEGPLAARDALARAFAETLAAISPPPAP